MKKTKIGVLISGGGSNLQALLEACAQDDFPAEIVCVISNKQGTGGLERAEAAGVSSFVVPSKGAAREEFEQSLQQVLAARGVEMVCLAGFMRILSADFIAKWQGRILNIHPSLLPAYGGEGMFGRHVHAAVLAAGEKESGASVHIVTDGCDEGPVILQKSVPVLKDDTPETLAARVLETEHEIYPLAVKAFVGKHFP